MNDESENDRPAGISEPKLDQDAIEFLRRIAALRAAVQEFDKPALAEGIYEIVVGLRDPRQTVLNMQALLFRVDGKWAGVRAVNAIDHAVYALQSLSDLECTDQEKQQFYSQ